MDKNEGIIDDRGFELMRMLETKAVKDDRPMDCYVQHFEILGVSLSQSDALSKRDGLRVHYHTTDVEL
jgi:hypothetical protein